MTEQDYNTHTLESGCTELASFLLASSSISIKHITIAACCLFNEKKKIKFDQAQCKNVQVIIAKVSRFKHF